MRLSLTERISIRGGRKAGETLECAGKMTLIGKTGFQSDDGERRFSFGDFAAGVFNPQTANVFADGALIFLPENAG